MKNSLENNKGLSTTKKFDFNYDLSGLDTYTSYASDMLLKSVLGMVVPKYASVRADLKGTSQQVGFVTNEIFLSETSCGWNPSGTTNINTITVDMCNLQSQLALCGYDLYNTYLSQYLSNDNFIEQVPFEETILTDVANRLANQVELRLWQNTTGDCFTGLIDLVTSGNGATSIAYTAATASNGLDVFTTYYQNLNENILPFDDIVIFCSYSDYRALVASMRNSSYVNLFQLEDGGVTRGADWKLLLPGTNVAVVPTQGLSGANRVIAGRSSYIMFGMNAETMQIRSMYDNFQDEIKINSHLSFGLGVFSIDDFLVAE